MPKPYCAREDAVETFKYSLIKLIVNVIVLLLNYFINEWTNQIME